MVQAQAARGDSLAAQVLMQAGAGLEHSLMVVEVGNSVLDLVGVLVGNSGLAAALQAGVLASLQTCRTAIVIRLSLLQYQSPSQRRLLR